MKSLLLLFIFILVPNLGFAGPYYAPPRCVDLFNYPAAPIIKKSADDSIFLPSRSYLADESWEVIQERMNERIKRAARSEFNLPYGIKSEYFEIGKYYVVYLLHNYTSNSWRKGEDGKKFKTARGLGEYSVYRGYVVDEIRNAYEELTGVVLKGPENPNGIILTLMPTKENIRTLPSFRKYTHIGSTILFKKIISPQER